MSQTHRVDFVGKLRKAKMLSDGSLKIPARISRTGVQTYDYTDGSRTVEYRDPKEVFNEDSLESFRGMAVTVLHPAKGVNPDNWRKVSVGHVADDVRADGDYVAASLIIKDATAIQAILGKELVELSCGYTCKAVPAKGEYKGDQYDTLQTDIRGNHVALGPEDWGRAGNNVRVYLDSQQKQPETEESEESEDVMPGVNCRVDYNSGMSKKIDANTSATDGQNSEDKGQEKGQEKGSVSGAPKNDAAKSEKVVPFEVYERACAERDDAKARLVTAEKTIKEIDSRVDARVSLIEKAKAFVAADYVFAGKSDSQVRTDCLVAQDKTLKLDGKSEAYIEARFDLLSSDIKQKQDAADASRANLQTVVGELGKGEQKVDARTKMVTENAKAFEASFKR